MRRPVRVLLADDHTMFREGLAALLSSYRGVEVVGQTTNDDEAVELARRARPDVVLMQIELPLECAAERLRQMRELPSQPKAVIVTMLGDPRYVRELARLGARAYVVKSASVEHLLGAVRAAVMDPEGEHVVVGMPQEMMERGSKGTGGVISAREMEILLLVARGRSNGEVADALYLSEATVKRHLSNAYSKMGVGSRTEAVRKAFSEGWITVLDVVGGPLDGEGR